QASENKLQRSIPAAPTPASLATQILRPHSCARTSRWNLLLGTSGPIQYARAGGGDWDVSVCGVVHVGVSCECCGCFRLAAPAAGAWCLDSTARARLRRRALQRPANASIEV